ARLTAAPANPTSALYASEERLVEQPTWLIDDNKVRAAVGGRHSQLIDFWRGDQVPAGQMARGLMGELADDAAALGCAAELELLEELLEGQTGAQRQLRFWERNGQDLSILVREMVADTRA